MNKMYGDFTSEELDEWQSEPHVAFLLTTPHFGAWLWRRDENRDKSRDVKPVVHGKWIKDKENKYHCSHCGRSVTKDTMEDMEIDYPYCHCGSLNGIDMRGE